jgi:hypothetical protein
MTQTHGPLLAVQPAALAVAVPTRLVAGDEEEISDAEWGVDPFQLAKLDGSWTIMNVIWQTNPPQAEEEE